MLATIDTGTVAAISTAAVVVIGAITTATVTILKSLKELRPNGGSSMNDKITRVDLSLGEHIASAADNRINVDLRLSDQDRSIAENRRATESLRIVMEEIRQKVCSPDRPACHRTDEPPRVQT